MTGSADEIRVLYVGVFHTDRPGPRADDVPFAADVVGTVEDAVSRFEATAVDCVVSAYALPDGTGVELLERVRDRSLSVPFVLVPEEGSEAVAREAITAGVTEYVPRADGWRETLAERVREAVDTYRNEIHKRDLKARAVDEAPIGVTIADPDREDLPLIYANREFERLTGYSVAAATGRNCRYLQGEGTDPEPVAALREGIEAADAVTVTLRNYRQDGTEFWNRVSVAPLRDATGAVTNYVGFQQDVTADKERERTLETLHTAAADIQECQSIVAACERTVEAAASILDLEVCSVLLADDGYLDPVALSEDAPPDGARRVPDDHGLAGETYQSGESRIVEEVTPDDETDPAKESYRSGISVPIGDHGVFQAVSTEPAAFDEADVTFTELLVAYTARTVDRLEYEQRLRDRGEALQRQNDRLERLAGFVSHDLRNPLNVAAGQLTLAQEECDSDRLDAVARAHGRMEDLIERLLTLAREGGPVEELESVALSAAAQEAWENVATADATLTTPAERTIRADPGRLQQLLENLVRNAVEHGSTSSRPEADDAVEHGSTSPDSQARQDTVEHAGPGVTVTIGDLPDGFYVADDGPGIDPEDRASVFEYGYSSRSEGTGFGLAIVREIAEAHGWKVTVTESEGGGARFEFTGVVGA